MHRIVWSRRAQRDLARIHEYVGQFAPLAAQRLALKPLSSANSLSELPLRGRAVGARRRVLTAISPYQIWYRIEGEVVEIITVRHGARDA